MSIIFFQCDIRVQHVMSSFGNQEAILLWPSVIILLQTKSILFPCTKYYLNRKSFSSINQSMGWKHVHFLNYFNHIWKWNRICVNKYSLIRLKFHKNIKLDISYTFFFCYHLNTLYLHLDIRFLLHSFIKD